MFNSFLEDSERNKRRLSLIRQHHLERVECFKLEDESWQALKRTHRGQVMLLASMSPYAQATFQREQIRDVREWQRKRAANRELIRAQQEGEIADLNRQDEVN